MRTPLRYMRDMIECLRIKPLLHAYLDNHVSGEDALRISTHLDACRRCGLRAETFRLLKARLAQLAEKTDRAAVQRLERLASVLATD